MVIVMSHVVIYTNIVISIYSMIMLLITIDLYLSLYKYDMHILYIYIIDYYQ